MSRFHRLRIASVERETRDAVAVTFEVPPGLEATFRYAAGQHLTLRASVDGQDLRRSYSICSAVQDGRLRIAVKKAPGGLFSTWANAQLGPGYAIEVMPPLGHFALPCVARETRRCVAFAAGSGITPIVSIIETTLRAQPASTFTLVYGNRSTASVMFREALADLKDRFMTRLDIVHVMSREPQEAPLLSGRIDRAKCDALVEQRIDIERMDVAYVCGPDGMMQAVAASLAAHGVPAAKIRIERFAASIPRHVHEVAREPAAEHARCAVTAIIDGVAREFELQRGRENIIDAALRQGVELPYSCKGGVCSTCRAKLVHGEVDMDVNFALEDYEVARGFVLCCQSYPATDAVTVDFDQVA